MSKKKKNYQNKREFWDTPILDQKEEVADAAKEVKAVTLTQKFKNFSIEEIIFRKEKDEFK